MTGTKANAAIVSIGLIYIIIPKAPKILIGQDTRLSGSLITNAFAGGAMCAGAKIIDIGICPTAGIAYLTKALQADYSVVISASHNPPEYNGIKIFNAQGFKLGDNNENNLERKFVHSYIENHPNLGTYEQKYNLTTLYLNHLVSCCSNSLNGIKVVLDCSNGAAYKIAPNVFKKLGAKVIKISCKNDGANINNNCGSLHPQTLAKSVIENKADFGFAFDGDSDRIIACDEKGNILDGDMILFMLAKYFKNKKMLKNNTVVGTRHTNMGLEESLKKLGIKLIRTDIGDKYVLEKMEELGLNLGGEKSGHIIIRNYATTGDGILTAVILADMVVSLNKPLSVLSKVKLYPQINIDCPVSDKMRVINSEKLNDCINKQEVILGTNSRIMVRVSGTEAKIRIMVESKDKTLAQNCAKNIQNVINQIEGETKCAE